MIYQKEFKLSKYWICFEGFNFRYRPIFGEQYGVLYFYWLWFGIQVGIEDPNQLFR